MFGSPVCLSTSTRARGQGCYPEGSMARRRTKPSKKTKAEIIIDFARDDETAMELLRILVYENKDPGTISACASHCDDISASGPDALPPLHIAAGQGNLNTISLLLQLGARVDATNHHRATALHYAALLDQPSAAHLLVKARANVDAQDECGMTALHLACIHAPANGLDNSVAAVLISAGANVHRMNEHRQTPAMLAMDNTGLIMRMLRHGSKPSQDVARLYAARCSGSKQWGERLRILVDHGWAPPPPQRSSADSTVSSSSEEEEKKKPCPTHDDGDGDGNGGSGPGDYSQLHAAVMVDDHGVYLKEVLALGEEDPNTLDLSGHSALAVAAWMGDVGKVEALLGAGAAVDLKGLQTGYTALHLSAAGGHAEVAKLLLAAALSSNRESIASSLSARGVTLCGSVTEGGTSSSSRTAATNANGACSPPAVLDMMDSVGNRPLHIAAINNNVQVMEVLLEGGADVDSQNKRGGTPLLYAVEEGNAEAVMALLKAGASPDPKDYRGFAALHVAMLRPAGAIVEALLAGGASPGLGGERGLTPLHLACEWNAPGTVEALLRAGAAPGHCWNDVLDSPLMVACKRGNLNAVKLLLPQLSARQINMRSRTFGLNQGGETPLMAAVLYDCFDESEILGIVEALLEAGADPTISTSTFMDPLAAVVQGENTKTSRTLGPPLIRALVAAGANVNGICSTLGFMPLHTACFEGACREVVQALLDAGADPCMPCGGSMLCAGMTFMSPLQLAGAGGNKEAVELLIKHPLCGGLNAVGASPARATVLVCAVQHGKTEVCRFLLEEGASMDLLPSSSKATSLVEMAAQFGHLDVMRLLMKAKVFKGLSEEAEEARAGAGVGPGGDG